MSTSSISPRCLILSKKTEKIWLWRAFDPVQRRTLPWLLGRRGDAASQKRLNKVGLKGHTVLTDGWEDFHRLIPEDQLFTGKDLTFPIEPDNGNICYYLARLRRRTKVVSKCPKMVDLSRRLHHHLRDPKITPHSPPSFYLSLCRTLELSGSLLADGWGSGHAVYTTSPSIPSILLIVDLATTSLLPKRMAGRSPRAMVCGSPPRPRRLLY